MGNCKTAFLGSEKTEKGSVTRSQQKFVHFFGGHRPRRLRQSLERARPQNGHDLRMQGNVETEVGSLELSKRILSSL